MAWIKLKAERLKRKAFFCTICCFSLFAFSFQPVSAQTFAEWFSQKKTQLKYLTQQIAALEQYESGVRQGYRIAQGGWGGIGNWVKGEFDLHSAYYSSLKNVNPAIRANPKADSTVSYAMLIPQQFDHLNGLAGLDQVSRDYIASVRTSVMKETDKDLSELQLVMTDGKVEMTDDERITRLDQIDARVKDKLAFVRSFCNSVRLLIVQRNNSNNDINTLKKSYGIN